MRRESSVIRRKFYYEKKVLLGQGNSKHAKVSSIMKRKLDYRKGNSTA